MRKLLIAAALTCSPALLAAQATNPESSGAPASAQQNPMTSGSAQSMPQGAATMQNDTPTGTAGMATNGNGTDTAKRHHSHHMKNASGSSTSGMTGGTSGSTSQ